MFELMVLSNDSYGMVDDTKSFHVSRSGIDEKYIRIAVPLLILGLVICFVIFKLIVSNKSHKRSNSIPMSESVCNDNLGYGANSNSNSTLPNPTNLSDIELAMERTQFKSQHRQQAVHDSADEETMSIKNETNRLPMSTSQHSLKTFVSNKNISRVYIEQKNLLLNYSLLVTEENSTLTLNVISLENLRAHNSVDWNLIDNLNVYIRVELVYIDSEGEVITRVARTRQIKNRQNPVFDETFEFADFRIQSEVDSVTKPNGLYVYVCNSNMYGRDQLLGEYVQPLHESDLINPSERSLRRMFARKIYILDPKTYETTKLGQLEFEIFYKNSTKSLFVSIIKGHALKLSPIYLNHSKVPSTFVKVYLLYKGQCIQKNQTNIIANSSEPHFNESFELDLSDLFETMKICKADRQPESNESEQLDPLMERIASKLEIFFLVMDHDHIEKTDAIGKIQLNDREFCLRKQSLRNEALDQRGNNWFEVFTKPNQPKHFICDITNF